MSRVEAEYYLNKLWLYRWAMKSPIHNLSVTIMRFVLLPFAILAFPILSFFTYLPIWWCDVKDSFSDLHWKGAFTLMKRNPKNDELIAKALDILTNKTP